MSELSQSDNQAKNREYIQTLMKGLKLENSEAFYYSLVENIPQFLYCKDLEGRFTFVNQLFCGLVEKPIEEVIGKTDYDFFPEELAHKYREDDRKVIEQNRPFEAIEENKISHRETKVVHVMKVPIRDAGGTVIGTQGIFTDITKRIKAEEELKNAYERMRHDLMAAAKVQRGFIPERPPKIPGFRFSWLFEPSEYVGGDILNIIRLDEKRWAFYVLDVSGHGVPAALLSVSLTRMIDQTSFGIGSATNESVLSKTPDELLDPKKVVHRLNQRFPGDDTKFCTLLYAILNTEDSSITWIRAGHIPPLLVNKEGSNAEYLFEPAGIFISNMPSRYHELQTKRIVLEPGDRFILCSDGITEAMKNDQEYGYDRLADVMRATASKPLHESIHVALSSVSEWTGVPTFSDDVTLLALERSKNGS